MINLKSFKRHNQKQALLKDGFLTFPRKIMIQTHSRCNAACGFCPYPDLKKERYHGLMTPELFNKILDELKQYHPHIDTIMPYLMNEPLLDPLLVERVNSIKSRVPGASVHFLTNGTLLDETLGNALIDSSLNWIGLSVFGITKEIYETSMGVSFDHFTHRIVPFVKKALHTRGPEFILITFFKWGNMTDIDIQAMHRFWQNMGVERISFFESGISRAGNAKYFMPPEHKTMKSCLSVWSEETLHILNDGHIIPCCMDWKRENVLGSLLNENIQNIWLGEKYMRFRDTLRGRQLLSCTDMCSRCEMAGQ